MPIVSAVCPSCGGQLEVDNGKEAGICQFCGNAFITEKAINNYHIKYEVKADTVIRNSKTSMEDLLEREAAYIKISDFPHLEQLYEDMTKLYPRRHEGWWGKIMLETKGFSNLNADMQIVAKWFGLVEENAPKKVLPDLEKQYHSYILARMKQSLAEKQLQLQKADSVNKTEEEMRHRSIGYAKHSAVSDATKTILMTAAIIGCIIGVFKFFAAISADVAATDDITDNHMFGFLGLIGLGIVLLVKMLRSDWFSDSFAGPSMIKAARQEYEDCVKRHAEQRKQAVNSIEDLKTKIEKYAKSHGIPA
jgi:hypothetical protein